MSGHCTPCHTIGQTKLRKCSKLHCMHIVNTKIIAIWNIHSWFIAYFSILCKPWVGKKKSLVYRQETSLLIM